MSDTWAREERAGHGAQHGGVVKTRRLDTSRLVWPRQKAFQILADVVQSVAKSRHDFLSGKSFEQVRRIRVIQKSIDLGKLPQKILNWRMAGLCGSHLSMIAKGHGLLQTKANVTSHSMSETVAFSHSESCEN